MSTLHGCMIQSRTGMSVEAGQNQAKDCDFSLHFNPQVKGHVKQVLEAKFCAHLGGGASLHRHVVADLQAVTMMSEKSGFAA